MVDFVLNATVRSDIGKGASRRLRRLDNLVPAIIYGLGDAPESISLANNQLSHALDNEAFYSHIIELSIDSKSQNVILKDVQRHPARAEILHVDFLRVDLTQKLTTRAPLHFINEEECHGVKIEGGQISHNVNDLEIECLPGDLPEYIEVDMAEVTLGQTLHISDVILPEGVVSVALTHGEDHDLPIAAVVKSKAIEEDELDVDSAEAGDAAEGDEAEGDEA
ncbi:MAG: 50S ribosomal protein L25/general stress protein Ctc [Gammaproteobacteria bacterium]|nr:50S ribosomal protein L25/general stress protein Ctc [Gammaproteobacteria bacterium]MBQ0839553.1 50S ribosomal protein L25/general stress protein Ctc [Gammaproteobacteria bacterium]